MGAEGKRQSPQKGESFLSAQHAYGWTESQGLAHAVRHLCSLVPVKPRQSPCLLCNFCPLSVKNADFVYLNHSIIPQEDKMVCNFIKNKEAARAYRNCAPRQKGTISSSLSLWCFRSHGTKTKEKLAERFGVKLLSLLSFVICQRV